MMGMHKVRTAEKPYSPRTTASVDSQSVDTTPPVGNSAGGTTTRTWTGGSATSWWTAWGCCWRCW